MRVITLSDFSSGLMEALSAYAFDNGQWSQLRGFVMEDEAQLRSQWACQKVSTSNGFVAVRGLSGPSGTFLVAIKENGTLWAMPAPSRTADYTVTAAATWTEVGSMTPTTGVTPLRFLCEVPLTIGAADRVNGLLVHSLSGTTPAVIVYEDPDNPGVITTKKYTNFYPGYKADNITPKTDVLPRANVGTYLRSRLILGDIQYINTDEDGKLPSELSAGTVKRYQGSLWYSQNRIDQYFPTAVIHAGSPGAQILALHELDDSLIVITTQATDRDGVIVLRGNLSQDEIPNLRRDLLRAGSGGPRRTTDTFNAYSTLWAEAGVVVWIDALGGIWHSDGTQVSRLDRYGPNTPKVAVETDHLAAIGKHLFAARAGRLLVMTSYGATGAWTELVPPTGGTIRSLAPADGSMYFIVAGQVWRYALDGPTLSERGCIDGQPVTLTVSTPTVGNTDELAKVFWFHCGLRVRGLRNATVSTVTVRAGAALADGAASFPKLTTTIDRTVAERDHVIVRGHGDSIEASATATFSGDLILEEVEFHFMAGANKRGGSGL